MSKSRFVQIKNLKTDCFTLIDKLRGNTIACSNPNRPFHRIQIEGKSKKIPLSDEALKRYFGLIFDEKGIRNSLFQQIMSKYKPKMFPIFTDRKIWDNFVPITQLEKLVFENLKKHRPDEVKPKPEQSKSLFHTNQSVQFNRNI